MDPFYNPMRKAAPLIVPPEQEHKYTVILLHGRGDRADSFGTGFLNTPLIEDTTLRPAFPCAKWIFLQAPLRELAAFPGTKVYQWFDVPHLRPGAEETDLQISGLRETIELVHGTLKQEVDLVGAENVVLGGLSQGCASALTSLLLWDGEPFAACIGLCGWLPFRRVLEDASKVTPGGCQSVAALATKLAYADTYTAPTVFQGIPVFMGHGLQDETIKVCLGREASSCIAKMGATVTYKEYDELAHWYSQQMLQDMVDFLATSTRLTRALEQATTDAEGSSEVR